MLEQTDAGLGPETRGPEKTRDEVTRAGQQSFGVSDKRRERRGTAHRFSCADTVAVNRGVVSGSPGGEKGGCGIPEQTKRCLHHAPPPFVCSTLPLRMRRPRHCPETKAVSISRVSCSPEWPLYHSPKEPIV